MTIDAAILSYREALEKHRSNPTDASTREVALREQALLRAQSAYTTESYKANAVEYIRRTR